MKPLWRALALGVGPLVLVLGTGLMGEGDPVPKLNLISTNTMDCSQPPIFESTYQLGKNYVTTQLHSGFRFNGESWIKANLCSPGNLRITAEGDLGGDEKPQLTVFQDKTYLGKYEFSKERTISVEVLQSGNIYLAYLNDFFLADMRIAALGKISFTSEACKKMRINYLDNRDGEDIVYDSKNISISRSDVLVFTPCGVGHIYISILGSQADHSFPVVAISRSTKPEIYLQTNNSWSKFDFQTDGSSFKLYLKNPYFKVLKDRNLIIKSIDFIPRQY